MGWHSAKLLFVAVVDGRLPADALVEVSIRVFRASDLAQAAVRAEEIGHAAAHDYKNEDGQTVEWRFVRAIELQDLCEDTLEDGVEVFSLMRRIRPSDGLADDGAPSR